VRSCCACTLHKPANRKRVENKSFFMTVSFAKDKGRYKVQGTRLKNKAQGARPARPNIRAENSMSCGRSGGHKKGTRDKAQERHKKGTRKAQERHKGQGTRTRHKAQGKAQGARHKVQGARCKVQGARRKKRSDPSKFQNLQI
jgi:hypothetical protein